MKEITDSCCDFKKLERVYKNYQAKKELEEIVEVQKSVAFTPEIKNK